METISNSTAGEEQSNDYDSATIQLNNYYNTLVVSIRQRDVLI